MKFASLFNPVSLPSDPEVSEDGSLYFNTASSVYRAKLNGNWVSIVDENNLNQLAGNNVIEFGDDSTISNSIYLNESYENSTLYVRSSSVSTILIGNNIDYPIRTGAEFKIIYAGTGEISVQTASSITLNSPSDIYLTTRWDSVILSKLNDSTWVVEGEFRDLY